MDCTSSTVTQIPTYQIGHACFDPRSGEVTEGGRVVRLEPLVASVLNELIGHAGELVSRQHIFDEVWQGRIVVDESVTRCVAQIRRALGDTRPYSMVETLPKRGYRLNSRVQPCDEPPRECTPRDAHCRSW